MRQYGYIEKDDGPAEALYTENGISEIIKTVQRYGAIEETGKIDNATLKLMSSRRCGVPDVIRHNNRRKRYALGSNGWEHRNITYYISNWPPRLGEYKVVKTIQQALDTWGAYARLNFQRAPTQDADIVVLFGAGDHGDEFPFDGQGYVLAHAFFPLKQYDKSGDIHFDADEKWVDRTDKDSEDGTDFHAVALHELGHSLGLAHSPVSSAVMFPYYKEYDPNSPYQLDYDDILGMYNLYITRVLDEDKQLPHVDRGYETTTSATSTARSSGVTDDWYRQSTTDQTVRTRMHPVTTTTERYSTETHPITGTSTSVTYEGDDETVDDHLKHDGKHTVPNSNSPSLPNICDGYVEAVATLRNELFVFKQQYIWRYKEKGKLGKGYPITIYQMFPQLPKTVEKIDAAYERPDGNIILFTGKMFWVHNGQQFIEDSPKSITHYGLPDYLQEIDAVQTWGRNGKTYFYRRERFWRYNETAKAMDPGYPLHMERWKNIPENLDAATTWKDGATYFFKGELFWKFDNYFVTATDESPMPTAQIWFGCAEDEQKMIRLFPENFS
ncbi:matrix metalloproteinase-2-like isoform X2 [Anoplophora glabripennis]|nr:matrix metalloproteinase-2-like isoform X2 [Anoplophora glabripennis]